MLDSLGHDIATAARGVWRARGISFAATLILGVGLALNVATFSVVSAVLLEPFPGRPRRVPS